MGHGHAVVAGGSLAGLAAAQALATTFDAVTLVERDHYPATGAQFRRGVPQARHLHVLLEGGLRALEALFPGLDDDLRLAGGHWIGTPQDLRWLNARGWCTRFPARRYVVSISRQLLDHVVWQRLVANPAVTILEGCTVTGLLPESTGVGGVRLTRPDGSAGELSADLVVDATGRDTRMPSWLAELGYPAPPETRIDAALAYSSRRYRIPPGFDADWKVAYLQPQPPRYRRLGGLFPLEDHQWLVSLGGVGGDRPPTDEAGFLEFARSLRSPLISEAIKDAEPLSDITAFHRTDNRRRHYEKLRRWPERLIVLGDAACAFNPIYAQGMTVAAQAALALRQALGDSAPRQPGFAHTFQRFVARHANTPWLIATGEDLRFPSTTGGKASRVNRLSHRWFDRVTSAGNVDPVVNATLIDVFVMLAKPTKLFRPPILWRTLRPRRDVDSAGSPAASRPSAPVE